jgi:hypothetical protein
VVIQAVNGDAEYSELLQLWSFIRALPHLESLDVRIVDCETLEYLGRLPSLKKLRTIIPDPIPLPGVAARSMFSNLRELSFRPEQQDPGGGEITPIIAFLRACKNPPLRSFEAPYIIEWDLEQVEELYQVLAGHILHNHLDMLQLEFLETDSPVMPPHPGRFFRHLFSFTRLTIIEIQVPSGYDLEDAIVAEMAHAWPNLEEFGLRSRSNYQPRCTLLSLHAFSRHCPRLWTLAITIDASSVPPNPIGSSDSFPQDKLKCLNVLSSCTSDTCVAAAAAFISSSFSNLTQIITDEGYLWEDGDTAGRARHQRWKEIERLVPGLVERREKELE